MGLTLPKHKNLKMMYSTPFQVKLSSELAALLREPQLLLSYSSKAEIENKTAQLGEMWKLHDIGEIPYTK